MSKRLNDGFVNEERLEVVRNKYLNPTIISVHKMGPEVEALKNDIKHTFNTATLDPGTKTIKFTGPDIERDVDLTPIIPVIPPEALQTIEVRDESGNPYQDIQVLEFGEGLNLATTYEPGKKPKATIRNLGPWAKFTTSGSYHPVKEFVFKGNSSAATISKGELILNIPEDPVFIKGTLGGVSDRLIEEIEVKGNVGESVISGGKLTIVLPDGGTGPIDPTKLNQNFKGFFESLGDIISEVKDPISGKSYAFAKDAKYGGSYYTPYFYVNTTWTELKQDPALLYSAPDDPQTHGVFSIKPDARITVDTLGQLDLSGLAGTPEKDRWFHGYFETIQDLNNEVRTPILYKSCAYVKAQAHGQVLLCMVYLRKEDGTNDWVNISPLGSLAFVSGETPNYTIAPIRGIKNNSMVRMGSDGIISVKEISDPELNIEISSPTTSDVQKGTINTIQFRDGATNAFINNKKLFVEHAQRVIAYNNDWELDHNDLDYQGKFFYDTTSQSWMGYTPPTVPGAVDVKWTRIAHRGMSDEVKDLSRRLPRKAPKVIPGNFGDSPQWRHSGWTYLEADNLALPEEIRTKGAYIQTYVKDDGLNTDVPLDRLQVCYEDGDGDSSWVRKYDSKSSGSDPAWKGWAKLSMTKKDIDNHNTDPGAHKNHHKFYKVATVDASWAELKAGNYKIKDSDLLLIADSHGISRDAEDTLEIPYTGQFRFSGRVEFDGWKAGSVHPKPQFIMYVYKVTPTQESIITEFAYRHADHTKPIPPLKWKSGGIDLKAGDKIRFEFKDFGGTLTTEVDLRMIPSRTYFVVEDVNTTAGSRIAATHKRTVGAINSRSDVGVNVHRNSPSSDTVRVYGLPLATTTVDMTKV